MDKIDKHYVSPLDKFLTEFDKNNPAPSASQQHEINKYNRINRLRDDKTATDVKENSLWEEF